MIAKSVSRHIRQDHQFICRLYINDGSELPNRWDEETVQRNGHHSTLSATTLLNLKRIPILVIAKSVSRHIRQDHQFICRLYINDGSELPNRWDEETVQRNGHHSTLSVTTQRFHGEAWIVIRHTGLQPIALIKSGFSFRIKLPKSTRNPVSRPLDQCLASITPPSHFDRQVV